LKPEPALYEFDIMTAIGRLRVIASKKHASYIAKCIAEVEESAVRNTARDCKLCRILDGALWLSVGTVSTVTIWTACKALGWWAP